MRCSLLLLSTFLDGELNQRRAAELDAHLIGCSRCQSGLAYLREESQRISGLAHVHVPDDSAEALLVHVGLIEATQESPGDQPAAPPEAPDDTPPAWRSHQSRSTLPWTPPARMPAAIPVPPAVAHAPERFAPVAILDPPAHLPEAVTPPAVAQPQAAQRTPEDAAQLEVPGIAVPSVERVEEQTDAAQSDSAAVDIEPVAPTAVPPSRPPTQRRGKGLSQAVRGMRDSLALRWALMRGGGFDDGAVDIVTEPLARSRLHPLETASDTPQPQLRDQAFQALETTPVERPDDAIDIPEHHDIPTLAAESPKRRRHALPADEDTPPQGRHLRGVATRRGGAGAGWIERTQSHLGLATASRSAASAAHDVRLWLFAGLTLLVLIAGLLLGKHIETPTGIAQQPAPSAQPSPTAPQASAPIASPTNAPTPAPLAPSPTRLTDAQTQGSGGSGFTVSDVRYGAHPGDYRIVFDMTGGDAGTPTATVGFGDATTLYVILAGTAPGGLPPTPAAGGTLVSITLVPHSPIPGHLVYELKLSKPVKVSTDYLTAPVRLVLDLR
ncbi:MAG TPA: zf-HC2 domain-containing protein [Candidatus Dormibacteraeota bacterium]|nr:zf-HC2 domain-containing protein [Candidatus Dormibacteraeota bacterium]